MFTQSKTEQKMDDAQHFIVHSDRGHLLIARILILFQNYIFTLCYVFIYLVYSMLVRVDSVHMWNYIWARAIAIFSHKIVSSNRSNHK